MQIIYNRPLTSFCLSFFSSFSIIDRISKVLYFFLFTIQVLQLIKPHLLSQTFYPVACKHTGWSIKIVFFFLSSLQPIPCIQKSLSYGRRSECTVTLNWPAIFCTTNSSPVLSRERSTNIENSNTIFNEHPVTSQLILKLKIERGFGKGLPFNSNWNYEE